MCEACWITAGHPSVYNAKVERAVALINALYEMAPTGGPLHAAVDDWNVTEDADWTVYRAHPYPADVFALADQLAALMLTMTVPERLSALAHQEHLLNHGQPTDIGRSMLDTHLADLQDLDPINECPEPPACDCPGSERWQTSP